MNTADKINLHNKETFKLVFDGYFNALCSFGNKYIKDISAVEDLTQEVWIKVYFGLDKFRFESKFSTWLSRITINRCINYLKRQGKLDFSENVEEIKNGSLPEINLCLDVTKLLSRLSITTKVLFTLKYIEELSYEEIAETTGTGVSAIKMRIARAKKDLVKYSQGMDTKKL